MLSKLAGQMNQLSSKGRGGSRGGAGGAQPPPSSHPLRFSNTTGMLQKKTSWFIGPEVDQETSAPPPKKILDPPL